VHVFHGPGIVLRVSGGLYVSNRPLTLKDAGNPAQRLVLSTYRVPGERPDANGDYTPPPTGVIAQVLEVVPPPDFDFQGRQRPARFALPKLGRLEGFGDRFGEIVFQDHGRGFFIFIGVGRRANADEVERVLHTLDELTIGAPPPSVTGA
jgi:hypothetical protein